jgi:hypothetical protein
LSGVQVPAPPPFKRTLWSSDQRVLSFLLHYSP